MTFNEHLAVARNWSVILLALEVLVLGLVPLFILFKITQGLAWLLKRFVPAMRKAQQVLLQAKAIIERIMAVIAAPFIWITSVFAGLRSLRAAIRRDLFTGR
jgi:hypothetical protein